MSFRNLAATTLSTLLLTACVSNPMRQYDGEMKDTINLVKSGSTKQALNLLEKNNSSDSKDILYYFEKGSILSLDNHYPESTDSWTKADEVVREWEDAVKTDASKVMGNVGSFLINDKTRRYDGQDYEKVMLTTNIALNYLMQGNYDNARVAMQRTFERETIIKNFREKEYDKLSDEAKQNQVQSDVRQMKDYPMGELDTPEVNSLKNGYQNAFAHYLAGYFFEVTNERSLAEPGYRNAVNLAPNSRLARESLKNIGRNRPGPNQSDVLFVIESGFAPAWKSVMVPIPIPRKNGAIVTQFSFPIVKTENPGELPGALSVAGKQLPVDTLSNIDAMSRRMLKDQMPGILLRTVIRSALKSVAQDQANKANPILGLAANVATVATEQADDRSWRMLPERIAVARANLPVGMNTVEFQVGGRIVRADVAIGERFSIVPIRITGGQVFVGEPSILGTLPAAAERNERPAKRQPAKRPVNK